MNFPRQVDDIRRRRKGRGGGKRECIKPSLPRSPSSASGGVASIPLSRVASVRPSLASPFPLSLACIFAAGGIGLKAGGAAGGLKAGRPWPPRRPLPLHRQTPHKKLGPSVAAPLAATAAAEHLLKMHRARRPSVVRVRALPLPNPKPVLLAWRDEGTEGRSEAGAPRFAIGGLRGEAPLRISLFPVSRASSARRREGGSPPVSLSLSLACFPVSVGREGRRTKWQAMRLPFLAACSERHGCLGE